MMDSKSSHISRYHDFLCVYMYVWRVDSLTRDCFIYTGFPPARDTIPSVRATGHGISGVVGEEDSPAGEEDSVEAARRIRLGGLEVGILYD